MAISKIKYTQIIEKLRFDAEYYQPEFLNTEEILRKSKSLFLNKIAEFSKLRGNPTCSPEKDFQYIDISNIDIFSGDIKIQMIKGYEAPSRARKIVKTDDIIISTVRPNRNAVAIIPKELDNQVCSTGFAVIKSKKINPWFLFAYLKTKYATNQLVRSAMASMYPAVSEDDIGAILIPTPPVSLQEKIALYVKEAYQKRQEADRKYKEAEELFNEMFGTDNLIFEKEKNFETKFNEVETSLRFDAEHYQPKYKKVKEFIGASGYKATKLKELIIISNKKINPLQEPTKYFSYIEFANINPATGEIEDASRIIGYDAPSRARMLVKTGDVLVASLAGSLENVALVSDEFNGAVASTGFFVVRSDVFSPGFLFLMFNSNIIKLQLEEKISGAIMSAVPKTTFGDLLVPLVNKEKQKSVAGLIDQTFRLRKEAKALLEKAKREIEKFIEGELK